MAQELPYFRFTVQEWQNGNICLERYELQGLFISICGFYWMQDCSITLDLLFKKFRNEHNLINELIELGIIKHEKRHNKIEIVFLNKQFDLLSEKRKVNRANGLKGSEAKARLKQNGSYKDKDNNKDKDKDNNKEKVVFVIPEILDIINYCNERKNKVDPNTFFDFYTSKNWMIGKNKMKDWKACIRTWEKNTKPEENKKFNYLDAISESQKLQDYINSDQK